jgi:hypothetical protein
LSPARYRGNDYSGPTAYGHREEFATLRRLLEARMGKPGKRELV